MAEKTLDPIFLGRIATFATSIGNLASNEADRKRLRHSIFVDFFQPLITSIRLGNRLVAELAKSFGWQPVIAGKHCVVLPKAYAASATNSLRLPLHCVP